MAQMELGGHMSGSTSMADAIAGEHCPYLGRVHQRRQLLKLAQDLTRPYATFRQDRRRQLLGTSCSGCQAVPRTWLSRAGSA